MKRTICTVIIMALLLSSCGNVTNDQGNTEDLAELQKKADELESRLDDINRELDALETGDTSFSGDSAEEPVEQVGEQWNQDSAVTDANDEDPYVAYFESAGIVGAKIYEEAGVEVVFDGFDKEFNSLQLSITNSNPENKMVSVNLCGISYNGLNCFIPEEGIKELTLVDGWKKDQPGVAICGKYEYDLGYNIVDEYSGGIISGSSDIRRYSRARAQLDDLLKCLNIESLDEFPLYKMGFIFTFDMGTVSKVIMTEWTAPGFSRSKLEALYGENQGTATIDGYEVRVFAKADDEYVHSIVLINDGNPFVVKKSYEITGKDLNASLKGYSNNIGHNKYIYPIGGYVFGFEETVDQIKKVMQISPSDDFSFYVNGNLVYTYK